MVYLWPTPDRSDFYTLAYWRLRRMQDTGTGVGTADIPFRFLPAMVAGLAYHLALKLPNGLQRAEMLKALYEEQWQGAAEEDREKASFMALPHIYPVT
jgi:hypothetical protein